MSLLFKNKWQEFLFLAITLLAFITFYIETDIYTPSFPEMVVYFGTDADTIQKLLSMNFLGLCLSSLFFGPASDAFGRKPVLCTGLFIFMAGSVGCAITESLDWMIHFRFLQGLGCGAIVSAGLATLFDVYSPEKSARLVSVLNGTVGGLMALAPMLGNWISLAYGWRYNFYLIALLATLTFACNIFFTKESLAEDKRTPLRLATVFKNYGCLLANFPFMAHNLIWCLMFSVVIMFIANLSLIFVDYLEVPKTTFGYYQTAIMGGFFVGSMSAAYLIKKIGMVNTKISGSLAFYVGVFALLNLSLFDINNPMLLIIVMTLASLGSALSIMTYFSYAMTHIGENLKGSAMSLTQSLRLFLSSGLVWVAANWFDGTTKPMSLIALFSAIVCAALYFMLFRRKLHVVAIS